MLKLLFVEDEVSAVEPVVNMIHRERKDIQCEVSGFSEAEDRIASFRPDIVILDLLVGGASAEPEPEGLKTRDFIWKHHFCPVVVYSAKPEIHDKSYESHPFMKSVQKGKGSPQKVLEALAELRPQVEALQGAEESIRQSFAVAMRDVAPEAFKFFDDTDRRNDMILRAGRRRLAALMDDLPASGDRLASWEQYICPPINTNIKLGDILRKTDGKDNDPDSFRVVLTPSCDLVDTEDRKPKVENVLVACCCSIKEGLNRTSLSGVRLDKLKDRLPGLILSHGYFESVIPFPCLEGRIPTMMADLRKLEFIPVKNINLSDTSFLRIASLDSPFRELVAWAYLQIACRPGIPDRDLNSWRDEIIVALRENKGDDKQT